LGRVIIDGRATNKYEFAKQIGDWVWVETIFADEQSGIPVRFETRGRSDANAGSITIYRHDTSIRIDPPTVDLEKRWSESLQRLSEEVEKGDPACRAEFFAAVERGRMAAFEFAIKGSFESSLGVEGTFVPSDAIQYWYFGQTLAAGGRTWVKKSWPDGWVEAPGKTVTDKIITSLFPPSEYVGRVACSGKVSVDGRDYDSYQYDFYRDSESARALYSHRSMLVEKATGTLFQNVSVSRTRARQWVETRRYDPTLTIQMPPPESTQRPPSRATISVSPRADVYWPPSGPNWPPFGLGRADAYWPPGGPNWPPFGLGRADAYWPPSGPNWPPFIVTPPAEANWPPYSPN